MENQTDSVVIGIVVVIVSLLSAMFFLVDKEPPLPTLEEAIKSVLEQYPEADGRLVVIEKIVYPGLMADLWGVTHPHWYTYYLECADLGIRIQIQKPEDV